MRFLFLAALFAVLGHAAYVFIGDAELTSAVSATPAMSGDRRMSASSIASTLGTRAEQHKCVVMPNGIEVDVHEPVAAPKILTQQIDMTVRCKRRGPFFIEQVRTIESSVTVPVGEGHANHWPVEPR